jgi:LysM repeat protein
MDIAGALGVIAALGALAGVSVAAVLVIRRSRRGVIRGLTRSGSRRVAERIHEIAAGRAFDAVFASIPHPVVPVPLGPRRRLWRDTSAALTVLGALVLVALIVDPTRPNSAVLDAIGAPASSRPAIAIALGSPRGSTMAETSPHPPTPSPDVATPSPDVATPAPTATAAPSRPHATAHPRDSSDRMAVLKACPATPDCYVYVVRRGDNLKSIASWFGIPYVTLLRLNPQLRDPSIVHAGDRITLPTPRR